MSKKNRKKNRKIRQMSIGSLASYPSKCPSCGNKTLLRTSQRTGQKFVGCLGFPGCNWSYNLNSVFNPAPRVILRPVVLKTGSSEEYYHELQLRCDIGDETARDAMDKLEKEWDRVMV